MKANATGEGHNQEEPFTGNIWKTENQLEMFGEAVRPTNARDEIDDRYDAAVLDGCPRGMLDLIAGNSKLPNVADQCDAICELGALGFDDTQIARATKMHKSRIALLREFVRLDGSLQAAVRSGEIGSRLAVRVLKLTPTQRARAAAKYGEDGTLTEGDVDAVKQVSKEKAVEGLPDFLFEMPVEDFSMSLEKVLRTMLESMDVEELRAEFERVLMQCEER